MFKIQNDLRRAREVRRPTHGPDIFSPKTSQGFDLEPLYINNYHNNSYPLSITSAPFCLWVGLLCGRGFLGASSKTWSPPEASDSVGWRPRSPCPAPAPPPPGAPTWSPRPRWHSSAASPSSPRCDDDGSGNVVLLKVKRILLAVLLPTVSEKHEKSIHQSINIT